MLVRGFVLDECGYRIAPNYQRGKIFAVFVKGHINDVLHEQRDYGYHEIEETVPFHDSR